MKDPIAVPIPKIPYFFVLTVLSLFLSSCGDVEEEIVFNADGSGTYSMATDIIPMMREMMTALSEIGLEEGETMDSLALEELIWKDFPDDVDSVMRYDEQVPDSIKNDPKKLAMFEQASWFMKGGRNHGYLQSGVFYEFKSTQEFIEFGAVMEDLSKDGEEGKMFKEVVTEYEITPTLFYRSSSAASLDLEELENQEALNLFGDSRIVTRITFPRPIKSVEVQTYKIERQGKRSLELSYTFKEAFTGGKPTSIRVELK